MHTCAGMLTAEENAPVCIEIGTLPPVAASRTGIRARAPTVLDFYERVNFARRARLFSRRSGLPHLEILLFSLKPHIEFTIPFPIADRITSRELMRRTSSELIYRKPVIRSFSFTNI